MAVFYSFYCQRQDFIITLHTTGFFPLPEALSRFQRNARNYVRYSMLPFPYKISGCKIQEKGLRIMVFKLIFFMIQHLLAWHLLTK